MAYIALKQRHEIAEFFNYFVLNHFVFQYSYKVAADYLIHFHLGPYL